MKLVEIQMKILVSAHCGASGHRGQESTENIVKEKYSWKTIPLDVGDFVKNCIHCLSAERKPENTKATLTYSSWE